MMPRHRRKLSWGSRSFCSWAIGLLAFFPLVNLLAGPKINMVKATPEQAVFFENKVRPLLSENCFSCHGGDPKKEPKAGLDMTTLEGLLLGGDSGLLLFPEIWTRA